MQILFNSYSYSGFLFVFFLVLILPAKAQDNNTIGVGMGASYQQVLDQRISPLRYNGPQATVYGQVLLPTEKVAHEWYARFDVGLLGNGANNTEITAFRTDISYFYWLNLNEWKGLQLQAGAGLTAYWSLLDVDVYTNNAFNNSVYSSINPGVKLGKEWTLFKRSFLLEGRFFIPLISFAVRPAYGSTTLEGFINNETDEGGFSRYLNSGDFTTVFRHFRFNALYSLTYPLESGNALQLHYNWDFYSFDRPQRVQAGTHLLAFGLLIQL
jgi:hypothetical protein